MAASRPKRGPGSRSRRGWVANTKAPASSYAVKTKGRRKYPIDTMGRARNALSRVGAFGSPAEKKAVYSAVKRRYPALARRSSIPALSGPKRSRTTRKKTRGATTRKRRRTTTRRR